MKLTSSSGRRLSVVRAAAGSAGSPQMPLPVMRIAPKPRRLTVISPPILNWPEAEAEAGWDMVLPYWRLSGPRPGAARPEGGNVFGMHLFVTRACVAFHLTYYAA